MSEPWPAGTSSRTSSPVLGEKIGLRVSVQIGWATPSDPTARPMQSPRNTPVLAPASGTGRGEAEWGQLAAPVTATVIAPVGPAGAVAAAVVILAGQQVTRVLRVDRERGLVLALAAAEERGLALVGALLVDPHVPVVDVVAAAGARHRRRRHRAAPGGVGGGRLGPGCGPGGGGGIGIDIDHPGRGKAVRLGLGGLTGGRQHRRRDQQRQHQAGHEPDGDGGTRTRTTHDRSSQASDIGLPGRIESFSLLLPRYEVRGEWARNARIRTARPKPLTMLADRHSYATPARSQARSSHAFS